MPTLAEKYRPKTLEEVRGHEKIKAIIKLMENRNAIGGKAFWISGNSGTGKTTLARIIAGYIAAPLFTTEIDAGECTADFVREFKEEMQYYAWDDDSRRGKALIVNEAHGLRADVIRALLVLLESIPSHCVVIFTTTKEAQEDLFNDKLDASPLLSRCIELKLSQRDITRTFAERAKEIAEAEGLDGVPLERYIQALRDKRNNLRAVLMMIESGEMMA